MPHYRKKPVVIEARLWDGQASTATDLIDWMLAHGTTARYHDDGTLVIDTREGPIPYSAGWVVIKGVQNEFYACEEDIFEQSYEAADADHATERIDWWITTGPLPAGGEKVLGPFESRELAIKVRGYLETSSQGRTYWVDDDAPVPAT